MEYRIGLPVGIPLMFLNYLGQVGTLCSIQSVSIQYLFSIYSLYNQLGRHYHLPNDWPTRRHTSHVSYLPRPGPHIMQHSVSRHSVSIQYIFSPFTNFYLIGLFEGIPVMFLTYLGQAGMSCSIQSVDIQYGFSRYSVDIQYTFS